MDPRRHRDHRPHTRGDSVVLTGTKTAVQDADGARRLLVTAVENGSPASYLVDQDAPGVGVRRQRGIDITRTFSEVTLDDVTVPASRRVTGGADEAQRLLDDACVCSPPRPSAPSSGCSR